MFFKKGVLKNFAIFTGKYLYWGFFLNRVADLGLQLYQKENPTQVFPVNIAKYLRASFLRKLSGGCF